MSHPRVGVVGAGRVGAVLAARLQRAGHHLVGVSGRSDASHLRVQTLLTDIPVLDRAEVVRRAEIVILAVPDDALADVVAELAPLAGPGRLFAHTSGRHGLAVLAPFVHAGARAIAMHPAMTFTGTEVDIDRGCVFGVTAEPADRDVAETLVADLGGSVMWVEEADRATYHASLAHGANHLTTIVTQAMDLLREIGADDPAAVLRPLLAAALDNTLDYGDAALTGPVARGDVDTVRAHVAHLHDPSVRRTYAALATATADRAESTGRIDTDTADAVRTAVIREKVR
ncbi:Rossmann-like and DUF2520 domain-containing protein [Aeromicrobium choanae]|uniref:Predicted oxidoreductase, contains short-chain dehydrogenase (SDR) and DUF2520 domains n=1 Tax=Aeromicrobium choanae TaxID=1736691 RepID=A0A1T4YW73_9ACTN|nr:Rossmann-like and DUF2520 domain-containing protein [Aeromicrobium choanae]SKB05976.1 Predicted oxidoreductase, contains short-chain dehydrogenase (SDR) and DUF2520 domains [Aeromicrobium choanae]